VKLREYAIRLLVRIYPAAWRREFGAEFEELLQRSPPNVLMTINVLVGALSERVVDLVRRIGGRGEMVDLTLGARYDRLTKIVSGAVVVVLVAVSAMAMRTGAVPVLAVAVIALGFAFSPRGYEISDGAFRVKRLIGDVVIPLDRLRFVRDATAADFWGCVRLWGSGGLFGYYGWFWSKALGRSRWYVTDRNRAVVVTNGDKTILVSPEDHDGFVAAIRGGDAGRLATNARSASGGRSSLTIGLSVTAVSFALVVAAMLYAPGRPPVDLTRDSLVIHSRFFGITVPATSVDVANVRVVDLKVEPGWKPVRRTGGFGNPHYRAGNFRTASGRAVKLFTTGTERLVLLPPSSTDGTPVLLDAAEPDQFAARVREEWSSR
jgi:Bacterial PH domain